MNGSSCKGPGLVLQEYEVHVSLSYVEKVRAPSGRDAERIARAHAVAFGAARGRSYSATSYVVAWPDSVEMASIRSHVDANGAPVDDDVEALEPTRYDAGEVDR